VDIGLAYMPKEDLHFYTQVELSHGIFLEREGGERNSETRARLRQAYVTMTGPDSGLSLRVGRQRFEDERDWWYREDLDAARLLFQTGRLDFELSASRNDVASRDILNRDRAERSTNYFAVARYAYDDDTELSAYVLFQDRPERGEQPVFFGARSMGAIGSRLGYWIDAAIVRGTDDSEDIRAYGFDIGADYGLDLPLEPSLHFGVAFGSGDANADDGTSSEFRQTGLQGSYFYYGEVLGPELSNMWIYTAGVEVHPANGTSVRLLYHRYRQHHASDQLRDALIDQDPDGRSRDLGQALDIVASYEGGNDVYLDFILGMFSPGDAFAREADRAYFAQFLVTCEFW
jgi:alginate production protein